MKLLLGKRKEGDLEKLLEDISEDNNWETELIQEETLEATSVQRDQLVEQIKTTRRPQLQQ